MVVFGVFFVIVGLLLLILLEMLGVNLLEIIEDGKVFLNYEKYGGKNSCSFRFVVLWESLGSYVDCWFVCEKSFWGVKYYKFFVCEELKFCVCNICY